MTEHPSIPAAACWWSNGLMATVHPFVQGWHPNTMQIAVVKC